MGGSPRPAAAARPASAALGPWTYTVVGVLLAIVGFAGVVVFAGRGGVGGAGTTPVVVAAKDIPLRQKLTADDLRIQRFDANDVPPGSYATMTPLIGQIAAVDFTSGQPILHNLVSSSPTSVVNGATSYLPIPAGFVAVAIPSAEQQGVGGYVQAGDYISMIAVVSGSKYPVARTIFTNVRVIRVGPATAGSTSGGGTTTGSSSSSSTAGVASSLTVVVTQCDAEYLSWFLNFAAVRYTLESYQDYQPVPTGPDASCQSVSSAKGVTAGDVQRRWPGILTG